MNNSASSNYRWVICALLFFATTINYIDRQILSLIKPILDGQLHWTNAQFGAVNSAFQASYACSVLFFGWLIDRFGTKIGYAASIATWSIAAIAHAGVSTIGGFFGVRIALGLGEGGNFPAAIKTTALWFPIKERALATSIFNCGASIGAVLAPMIVPRIAASMGWQWAFVFAGMAGLIWLTLWWPLFSLPEHSRRVSAAELAFIESDVPDQTMTDTTVTWSEVLSHRQAWSFIVAKFLTDPVWWFFLIWLPDYFNKSRGLDIVHSWKHLATVYSIVTVLSIGGGWLTGFLAGRGWTVTRARKTGMLLFALCVLPIAYVTHVGNWTAVILIGLAGAAHQAWSANLFTTVSDMFPKNVVAKIIGVGTTAGSIGGIIFPILTGKVLDRFHETGYAMLFAFCSLAYLLAFVINHLLAPRFERVALLEHPIGFVPE